VITGRMADVCAELERMSQTKRSHCPLGAQDIASEDLP
jgi:hypothetical protein